ncbi:YIP1 family protein [Alteromonas halophila]|uniref:Yip1 domain-containing protein n=1 Tax=Alteromonas halophila TaxID=516698 RepID=A0A918MYP3_9ALTE|nr:YIP1 family protein [Alteromonas halophila]GGW83927.1 hypothetical protein GCM10007391_16930 [Alteromonas halophila]
MALSIGNSLLNIYVAPTTLFDTLKSERGRSLLPLFLIIAISFASILYFYSGMSTEWLVEQQMLQAQDTSPAEMEQMRVFIEESASGLGWMGAVFNVIYTLIMISALSGYFKLLSYKQPQYRYVDWFRFTVWTQMPTVIYMLGFMALIATSNTADLPLNLLNYASLNQVALHLPFGHGLFTWAETLNLFFIWSIALSALGLHSWLQLSLLRSAVLAAFPYIATFTVWALLA